MSMAGPGFGLFILFLVVSVGLGLGLYVLVQTERDNREVLGREAAERIARRDTDEE